MLETTGEKRLLGIDPNRSSSSEGRNRVKESGVKVVCVLVAALVAAAAWAGDISSNANGPWMEFSFTTTDTDAKGCSPADPSGRPCSAFGNSVLADAPPWTFTVGPQGATFAIVDAFVTGDVFAVYDGGELLGQTSDAPVGDSCGGDPDSCVGTSASYGLFSLAPGDHSITIRPVVSVYNVGAAYFRVDGDVAPSAPPPVPDTDGDGLTDDVDACPSSILDATVMIDDCDSGVENRWYDDGCTLADRVAVCTNGSGNHGMLASCGSHLLDDLKKQGTISGPEKDAIQSCIARLKAR
jgi:hypothetical protein